MKKVEDYVRSIPDFPEPGIIFRDVTSILQDADGLQLAIDEMQHFVEEVDCDVICGTESRLHFRYADCLQSAQTVRADP